MSGWWVLRTVWLGSDGCRQWWCSCKPVTTCKYVTTTTAVVCSCWVAVEDFYQIFPLGVSWSGYLLHASSVVVGNNFLTYVRDSIWTISVLCWRLANLAGQANNVNQQNEMPAKSYDIIFYLILSFVSHKILHRGIILKDPLNTI